MGALVNRYEFLAALHEVVRPSTYLEVGVHTGMSLAQAAGATVAIGVDPNPLTQATGNQTIYTMMADDFFAYVINPNVVIDLAFIDGMHLAEFALRDFLNVERHSHPRTVVAFDDVLPYNQAIAVRDQPPGDWTGDVWKVYQTLEDLDMYNVILVDTTPTGIMLVTGLRQRNPELSALEVFAHPNGPLTHEAPVPEHIINRSGAVSPDVALKKIKEFLGEVD